MAGHSKWSKIKRAKAANDTAKSKIFTKLSLEITQSAIEGGMDRDKNFSLRLAIDKAKAANMPNTNIDRAISKADPQNGSESSEKISYEAIGPQSQLMVIDCITDNSNRTVAELKLQLDAALAKLADPGSVLWQFEEKGSVNLWNIHLNQDVNQYSSVDKFKLLSEEKMLESIIMTEEIEDYVIQPPIDELLEGLPEDFQQIDISRLKTFNLIVSKSNFMQVVDKLQNFNFVLTDAKLVKIPTHGNNGRNTPEFQELLGSLIDQIDVQQVWHNVDSGSKS